MCELGGRMYRKGTRNTFSSCPFLCFTQNGQNNVTECRLPSRPTTGLGTQGPHRHASEDLPMEDPSTIPQKHHCRLHIGNLAIPMHVLDVEITDIRKCHHIGGFSSATGAQLGCSTSSGSKPSIAVNGPGNSKSAKGKKFTGI